MALNTQALARFAADILEELEHDPDVPDDAELIDAHITVELTATDPTDGERISMVHGFTMSERNVAGIGMLARAFLAALRLP